MTNQELTERLDRHVKLLEGLAERINKLEDRFETFSFELIELKRENASK